MAKKITFRVNSHDALKPDTDFLLVPNLSWNNYGLSIMLEVVIVKKNLYLETEVKKMHGRN